MKIKLKDVKVGEKFTSAGFKLMKIAHLNSEPIVVNGSTYNVIYIDGDPNTKGKISNWSLDSDVEVDRTFYDLDVGDEFTRDNCRFMKLENNKYVALETAGGYTKGLSFIGTNFNVKI